ncbi:MAG: hypothetical protein KatS3mg112_1624 [Thermogutta sp.]|nr:MAG: hypothetical protein KatS3mg112_1624 [Thermogutta sp.]
MGGCASIEVGGHGLGVRIESHGHADPSAVRKSSTVHGPHPRILRTWCRGLRKACSARGRDMGNDPLRAEQSTEQGELATTAVFAPVPFIPDSCHEMVGPPENLTQATSVNGARP